MTATAIEKAIKRVVRVLVDGQHPVRVAEAVQTLVGEINEGRKQVVSEYLRQLAEEWPEGRGRLLAEAELIDQTRQTSETLEKEEDDG